MRVLLFVSFCACQLPTTSLFVCSHVHFVLSAAITGLIQYVLSQRSINNCTVALPTTNNWYVGETQVSQSVFPCLYFPFVIPRLQHHSCVFVVCFAYDLARPKTEQRKRSLWYLVNHQDEDTKELERDVVRSLQRAFCNHSPEHNQAETQRNEVTELNTESMDTNHVSSNAQQNEQQIS